MNFAFISHTLTTGSLMAWWGRYARPASAYTAPPNSTSRWPGSRWSGAGVASISRLSSETSCLSPPLRTGLQGKHKYMGGHHWVSLNGNCIHRRWLKLGFVCFFFFFWPITWLFSSWYMGWATVLKEKEIGFMFPIISPVIFYIFLSALLCNVCFVAEQHVIPLHKCFWWLTHFPRDVDIGRYGEIFHDIQHRWLHTPNNMFCKVIALYWFS